MNWSRAKNILIVVFICLNLFLIFHIGKLYMESGISRETIANAEKILKNKGVKLMTEIPTYLSETGLPIYDEAASFYFNELLEKLPENINLENKDEIVKYVRGLLEKKGLPIAKFMTDVVLVDDDAVLHISFVDKYKQFFVFDNTVKIRITKSGYISVDEFTYKKMTGISAFKKDIIPAYQIILKNYGERDTITTITAIDIGFVKHKLDQSTTGIYEGPVWRVRLESGLESFYDGYSGQKIEQ